jgi:hypothetical protein
MYNTETLYFNSIDIQNCVCIDSETSLGQRKYFRIRAYIKVVSYGELQRNAEDRNCMNHTANGQDCVCRNYTKLITK